MLRSAPFSRLRLWPHSRRQRSRSVPRKDRSGLALPADQDADLFARLRLGRASARSQLSELARRKRRRGSRGQNGAAARADRRRGEGDRGFQGEGRSRRGRQASARLRGGVRGSCRSNARKSSTAWNDLATSRTPSPIASARRTRRCRKSSDEKSDGQAPPGASSQDKLLVGHPRLQRSPSERDLRLRGADADRTAYRGDRARGAAGCGAVAAGFAAAALCAAPPADFLRSGGSSEASTRQGEIGLSFSSSNGTP